MTFKAQINIQTVKTAKSLASRKGNTTTLTLNDDIKDVRELGQKKMRSLKKRFH